MMSRVTSAASVFFPGMLFSSARFSGSKSSASTTPQKTAP